MSYAGRIALLEHKRAALVARAAEQRVVLAGALEPLRTPAAMVDRGVDVVRFFRRYPAFLAAGTLVVAVLRPRAAWRWGRRAYMVWGMWRGLVRSGKPR